MNQERRARSLVALALAGAALGGAIITGCNLILDTSAYTVGTVDGSSADVMSFPDAGSEASTCGPASLPATSTTFQNIVTSCVLAVSCDPFYFQTTISECISEIYLQSVSSTAVSCLASISSCADYEGCAKQSIPTTAQCASTSMAAYCDATGNAINCGADSNIFVKNCVARGQTCATYNDGTATGAAGTVADCVVPGTCTTAQEDGNQHCDTNNNIFTCVNGSKYGENCNLINGTCQEDTTTPSNTSCYFNGTACPTAGYTCESNGNAQWCTGTVLFKFNCSVAGLTCALDDDSGTADCLAPGCGTSDYANCVESCAADGHTANVCIGGAQVPLDCRNYGSFKTCYDSTTNGIYCQ